jgi:hypothetical protein
MDSSEPEMTKVNAVFGRPVWHMKKRGRRAGFTAMSLVFSTRISVEAQFRVKLK